MGKPSKATKKFEKKHLKRTVDQRKIEQKYKKSKLKQKKSIPRNEAEDEEDSNSKNEVFQDMSVEDFMKGGFEIPQVKKNLKTDKLKQNGKENHSESESDSDFEIGGHQDDLKRLAEKDPEFYKYLKENDKELLNFNPQAMEDSDGKEEDDEDIYLGDEAKQTYSSSNGQIEITMRDIKTWKKSLAQENSFKILKKVIQAFSAAIRTSQSTDESNIYKYTVTDPDVFNQLLVMTVTSVPSTVKHHIGLKNGIPVESKKLKSISHSLKSYGASLAVLLSSNHDSKTVNMMLKSVQELLPYFLSFRKIIKVVINSVVTLLCESQDDLIKLSTAGFLHEASKAYPKSLLEMVLKSSYSGMIKASRKTNIHTMPTINLLKNSIASLYEIEPTISYQVAFQFIRQLAIHLRSSIVNKTADSYKAVYNWQYVHSLDFWSRVISQHCEQQLQKSSVMRELIHPLVQVTLGCIRLIPTPQYFPLRFYLTRSLLRLSSVSGVYIPLLPIITEILTSTTITKKPSPSTLRPLDFDHNIRASKSYIGTRVYQDGVCEQLSDLVGEFFVLHCKSIAFPELAIPAIITFKRFVKKSSQNVKFSKQLQKLVEKLDENSKFILQKRNKCDFGPTNREQVDAFLKELEWQKTPLGAFVAIQREIREEKLRIMRQNIEDSEDEESKRESDNDLGDLAALVEDDEDDEE